MLNERVARNHRVNNKFFINEVFKMSISSCLRSHIFLRRKEILPPLLVRTCSTEENEEKPEKNFNKHIKKRPVHPLEKCMEYMDSEAYKTTYGDKPVWHVYVRNFRGNNPPKTRKSCCKMGIFTTGSPCPICRDQYLLPHYQNLKLLKQFISPYGGEIIETSKTGVCQKQHFNLTVAIKKARNYGLLSFTVPHREYDYSVYNKK